MDKTEKQTGVSRRYFFRTAALGSAAAAGTAVLGAGEAEAAEPAMSASAAGYRETAHVKTYYELAKF